MNIDNKSNFIQAKGEGKAILSYLETYTKLRSGLSGSVATKDIVKYVNQFSQATGEELEYVKIKEDIYSISLKTK